MSAVFDDSDFRLLEEDLKLIPEKMIAKLIPVVEKSSLETKKIMRADMQKSTHFGQIAETINYDTHTGGIDGMFVIEGEIGPDKDVHVATGKNPAPLAHIAYWGGVNGGGKTVRDPEDAMLEVAPAFYLYANQAADGLL